MKDYGNGHVDGVPVMVMHGDIAVVGVCDLMQHLYGDTAFKGWHPSVNRSHEQEDADVQAWVAAHGAGFWSAPREDFSTLAAARFANNLGNPVVVVQDLS